MNGQRATIEDSIKGIAEWRGKISTSRKCQQADVRNVMGEWDHADEFN